MENETDEIRFFRKTDCELNGDNLKFYIDGELQQEWSGQLNWRELVFPVTQGEHTFTWTYEKNASGTNGADHVWLDDILFPVRHINFSCNAGANQNICLEEEAHLQAESIGYESLLWTTNGDGSFDHNDILNPIYTPGQQDLENKTVTLTLTATNEAGETLSDNVIVNFHEAASIEMETEGEICEGESINLSAITHEAGFTTWSTNGDGSFSNLASIETIYTPGEQDIANGSVTLTLTTISPYGCGDASQDFLLTIHPLQHTEFDMATCGAYLWNGVEYSEAGDYIQVLQSVYGCDSTVVMHLSLVDSYNTESEVTACSSYVWAGETLVESGIYEHTFTSIHGCDSTVVMHLTIAEPSHVNFTIEDCDSYNWNNNTYTQSGEYMEYFINTMGCDSSVTLHLNLNYTPAIGSVNGDSEVDVRLTPNSTYTALNEEELTLADYTWSIEPQEAGSIESNSSHANVTWSDTFRGDAVINVKAENECGLSEKSLTVKVKNSTDIDEYSITAKLYPNPTDGVVTVEAQSLQRLTVINALGQTVYDLETEGDSAQIEMARFGTGTFLIRIQTENGVAMRRVNVVK